MVDRLLLLVQPPGRDILAKRRTEGKFDRDSMPQVLVAELHQVNGEVRGLAGAADIAKGQGHDRVERIGRGHLFIKRLHIERRVAQADDRLPRDCSRMAKQAVVADALPEPKQPLGPRETHRQTAIVVGCGVKAVPIPKRPCVIGRLLRRLPIASRRSRTPAATRMADSTACGRFRDHARPTVPVRDRDLLPVRRRHTCGKSQHQKKAHDPRRTFRPGRTTEAWTMNMRSHGSWLSLARTCKIPCFPSRV